MIIDVSDRLMRVFLRVQEFSGTTNPYFTQVALAIIQSILELIIDFKEIGQFKKNSLSFLFIMFNLCEKCINFVYNLINFVYNLINFSSNFIFIPFQKPLLIMNRQEFGFVNTHPLGFLCQGFHKK